MIYKEEYLPIEARSILKLKFYSTEPVRRTNKLTNSQTMEKHYLTTAINLISLYRSPDPESSRADVTDLSLGGLIILLHSPPPQAASTLAMPKPPSLAERSVHTAVTNTVSSSVPRATVSYSSRAGGRPSRSNSTSLGYQGLVLLSSSVASVISGDVREGGGAASVSGSVSTSAGDVNTQLLGSLSLSGAAGAGEVAGAGAGALSLTQSQHRRESSTVTSTRMMRRTIRTGSCSIIEIKNTKLMNMRMVLVKLTCFRQEYQVSYQNKKPGMQRNNDFMEKLLYFDNCYISIVHLANDNVMAWC